MYAGLRRFAIQFASTFVVVAETTAQAFASSKSAEVRINRRASACEGAFAYCVVTQCTVRNDMMPRCPAPLRPFMFNTISVVRSVDPASRFNITTRSRTKFRW